MAATNPPSSATRPPSVAGAATTRDAAAASAASVPAEIAGVKRTAQAAFEGETPFLYFPCPIYDKPSRLPSVRP